MTKRYVTSFLHQEFTAMLVPFSGCHAVFTHSDNVDEAPLLTCDIWDGRFDKTPVQDCGSRHILHTRVFRDE
jgi:hypothetical protein